VFDIFIAFNQLQLNESYDHILNEKKNRDFPSKDILTDGLIIKCWSNKAEGLSIVETQDYISLVYGDLVYRRSQSASESVPSHHEVNNLLEKPTGLVSTCQGNYWIVNYHKTKNILRIQSNPLTTLPLYMAKYHNDTIICSNLLMLKSLGFKANIQVVFEVLLFNQPITLRTMLEGVNTITPGLSYEFGSCEKTNSLYDIKEKIFEQGDNGLNLPELVEDFNYSVLSLSSSSEINLSSLTGGFDSRCVLSSLIKEKLPYHAFSFGRLGGPNTEKPLYAKSQLGINYDPILLEREYEERYAYFADEAVTWSDGASVFERANYLYVADKLKEISNSYLSGLIGGELFGPMTFHTTFCSKLYDDVFYKGNKFDFQYCFKGMGLDKFVRCPSQHIVESLEQTVLDYQREIQELRARETGYMYSLYDFVKNGFRTFYGGQIHVERRYIHNKTPFYVTDIFERLMSSNHKRVFKKAFKSGAVSKRNNRLLQAQIILSNNPALASMPTDRGFAPSDVLSSFGQVKAGISYMANRYKAKSREPEFTSAKWSKLYYDYIASNGLSFDDTVFDNNKMKEFMKHYDMTKYSQQFNRLLSVARWLSM